MENNTNIIELRGITKVYEDGYTAVDNFNLEVKRGEFVTLLGPSGFRMRKDDDSAHDRGLSDAFIG